ncbi:MAG: nickel pincer cofactor biosynthesis protein LarC, partial [Solobacterium sp.]|nr:nickel pincer cofactor biosynthesis protein LarC [Solobacterium sp.]
HGHHHHHHSGMAGIRHIVNDHTNLPDPIKQDVLNVYGILADAESAVHGMTVEEIHFHEVGTMDAIADIAAVCWLMDRIHPDQIIASPVHVGSGTVRCAHGILPVPAPATANILKDIPMYSRQDIAGELCTPTGAALLKYYVSSFGEMPVIRTEAIGYGMGKKDFPIANCVRTVLGESGKLNDEIIELSCNVDDMTGEEIGFVFTRLMEAGARDVFTIPIGMKKNRPGTLINIVCRKEDRESILHILFRDTTTIGVRETVKKRYVLDRTVDTIETEYGPVRLKRSSGYGVDKQKYEYEDLAEAARKTGLSVREIRSAIEQGTKK